MIPQAFQEAIKKNFPQFAKLVAFDQIKNFYTTKPLPNLAANERFTDEVSILG